MQDPLPENLRRKLDELQEQAAAIAQQLIDPDVLADHQRVRDLSIKQAALRPIVDGYDALKNTLGQIDEYEQIISDAEDDELVALAREEVPLLRQTVATNAKAVQEKLVTADDQAIGSIILEVRAGVGGDEAGLWARDLVEMYTRFASRCKWSVETLDESPSEMGGLKLAIIRMAGEGVWANLGYEGGTHQVKRVPATETQGRVHTSTATVAVLPEPEAVEVQLEKCDVKEMITTAQGPGGQNVNKVATAVHLIHEPTGVEVRMQDTKSQAQNREKAWALLRARLFERQKQEAQAERDEQRVAMIGTGLRAEKIRTYRYKENIAVDHRIGGNFNLQELLIGRMEPLVSALIEHDTAKRLAAL